MHLILLVGIFLQFDYEDRFSPLVKAASDDLLKTAIEEMRFARTNDKLLVLPLLSDSKGQITESIRSAMAGSGKFEVMTPGVFEKLLQSLGISGQKQIKNTQEALDMAKKAGANAVLFGRVGRLKIEEGNVDLNIKFRILEAATGDTIFAGGYSNQLKKGIFSIPHYRTWLYDTAIITRIIVWLFVMLILPFVVLLFKEAALGTKPVFPVMMVLAFTFIDLMLAIAFMGFEIPGVWGAGLFVLALASCLFWNVFVTAKLYQMSHGASINSAPW